jgi:hypothetical protein
MPETLTIRDYADQRIDSMETARYGYWQHWRELAEHILPRRYRWLVTPNEIRSGYINRKIIDSTGTIAARILASGMMSGITSPARPWFKLGIEGVDLVETSPASLWLSQVEQILMRIFAESNFYNCIATVFSDIGIFGTSAMLIYEDYENVIQCYNPCLGEYYLENDDKGVVGTFARKMTQTAAQLAQWFGEENLSENARTALKTPGQRNTEFLLAHIIEANDGKYPQVPSHFKFREIYWEYGSGKNNAKGAPAILSAKGFHELPGIFPRWDTNGADAYGSGCPGMDGLGDIKQLQQETIRKGQAIDKMVNPPVLADVQLKNQPASLLPGGVTYVAGLDKTSGMRPIYTVNPPVQEIMMDIQEVQGRIKKVFYNDLFMMFEQLQAEPRSAAAVDVRREEKMIMLGPVLERFHTEGLDSAIDRTFAIALRANIIPPPPPEIEGRAMKINYVSVMADAQRAVSASGIERVLQITGNMAAIYPPAMDKLDIDQTIDEYAKMMGVTPKIIRSDAVVAQMREAQAKQQQQDKALAISMEGVNAAKTLSETDLGGGKTALQQMIQ